MVHPAVVRAWAPRAVVLWLGVRAIASAVLFLGGSNPLLPAPERSLLLVALTVAASFAQTSRSREWALLGNLGVSRRVLAAVYALPAVVGELLLATVAVIVR
jgi:hypothetical protein